MRIQNRAEEPSRTSNSCDPERKALIRNFVKGIEVVGDEATLTYTVPMPGDGATRESGPVLDFVKSGPLRKTRTNIRG